MPQTITEYKRDHMGLNKPYRAKEARELLQDAKYQTGDIVEYQGRTGEVEGVTLSSVTRGARLYRVRMSRLVYDVIAVREEELRFPPS